jgi:hypothetical protein
VNKLHKTNTRIIFFYKTVLQVFFNIMSQNSHRLLFIMKKKGPNVKIFSEQQLVFEYKPLFFMTPIQFGLQIFCISSDFVRGISITGKLLIFFGGRLHNDLICMICKSIIKSMWDIVRA